MGTAAVFSAQAFADPVERYLLNDVDILHLDAETPRIEKDMAILIEGGSIARIIPASNLRADTWGGFTPYSMSYSTLVKAEIRKGSAAKLAGPIAVAPQASLLVAPAAPMPVETMARQPNGMCEMARNDPASRSRSLAMRPFLAAKDAVWYNHPDELAGLLEDCVGVNDTDEYGWTLLHHAADRDRVELARILLDRGARSGPLNKDRQTAAHLATSAEMRALLGAPQPVAAASGEDKRKLECGQKYEADVALASDTTDKMSANRRWQQCLDTGRYW